MLQLELMLLDVLNVSLIQMRQPWQLFQLFAMLLLLDTMLMPLQNKHLLAQEPVQNVVLMEKLVVNVSFLKHLLIIHALLAMVVTLLIKLLPPKQLINLLFVFQFRRKDCILVPLISTGIPQLTQEDYVLLIIQHA